MSNIFENLELFSDFSEKQIKAIFKLGERKLIDADGLLFSEGDVSKGLYIVLGGKLSTSYNGVTKYFTAGIIFSVLSLVTDSKHRLTIKSEQKSQYFYLTKERYGKLKESSPKFALKLQENIMKHYLEKTEKLEKIFLEE